MSVVIKLKKIRDALLNVSDVVGHYTFSKNMNEYIVWAEDGEGDSLHLNDQKNEQTITGTIDLFTKNEYSETIDKIQEALNKSRISFVLQSVQYEEETKYIHYEWRFEI